MDLSNFDAVPFPFELYGNSGVDEQLKRLMNSMVETATLGRTEVVRLVDRLYRAYGEYWRTAQQEEESKDPSQNRAQLALKLVKKTVARVAAIGNTELIDKIKNLLNTIAEDADKNSPLSNTPVF